MARNNFIKVLKEDRFIALAHRRVRLVWRKRIEETEEESFVMISMQSEEYEAQVDGNREAREEIKHLCALLPKTSDRIWERLAEQLQKLELVQVLADENNQESET